MGQYIHKGVIASTPRTKCYDFHVVDFLVAKIEMLRNWALKITRTIAQLYQNVLLKKMSRLLVKILYTSIYKYYIYIVGVNEIVVIHLTYNKTIQCIYNCTHLNTIRYMYIHYINFHSHAYWRFHYLD